MSELLLLDVKELGRRLGIKPGTLLTWARQGKLPHYRLEGLVRFQLDEVKAWLQARHKQVQQTQHQEDLVCQS